MRHILFALLAITMGLGSAYAAVFEWVANTTDADIKDYQLYECVPATTPCSAGTKVPGGLVTHPTKTVTIPNPTSTRTYSLDAGDTSGNRSGRSNTVTFSVTPPVVTAPVLTLIVRGNPAVAPQLWSVEVTSTVLVNFSWYVNGVFLRGEGAAPFCLDGNPNTPLGPCTLISRAPGTYVIEAVALDLTTNVERARKAITVVVPDLLAPAAPAGLVVR